ncbi:GNAT family N-acetyltransferase [Aureibacter tunicatorum]|uniref:Acetyltransferase n=1 Tax=Aureibacter tunicatorum TaxID=866807 RepID=A0AAE3XSS8_9BACT|nr:GNAT family N-acetyltransferase [Aureibacter tunicatorum]MDR6240934.1 putative acetyltransferase [Aureibacter tunicatorum]BDD03714.1 N-acetyltransferase [Aureibacter tunicatorum]
MNYTLRQTSTEDAESLHTMYLDVAKYKLGIARYEKEINLGYIQNIIAENQNGGLGFIILSNDQIIGEIHAHKYGIQIFDHILSNLTIAVHPDFQGKGIGKRLFAHFLEYITVNRPDIWRVELESRANNSRSRGLYESLGFIEEGVMKHKTRNFGGDFEDSVAYAWFNENYSTQAQPGFTQEEIY